MLTKSSLSVAIGLILAILFSVACTGKNRKAKK
jgi:hypothetical protein